MLEWFFVVSAIMFGLGLIIIEIIFVPGTTIVGIIGLLFSIFGIYLSYDYFGPSVGNVVLTITAAITVISFVISIRSGVWEKLGLKSANLSRVNEGYNLDLNVGDEGMTISALRPVGKAEFGDKVYEVTTMGNFLGSGERVKIIKIRVNKIYVELVN